MSIPTDLLPLASGLQAANGWDNKMRQLVLASRQLPLLAVEKRTQDNLVKGCDSDVWLDRANSEAGTYFEAYSPSKVIRGVLAIILEQSNQLSTEALCDFDFDAFTEELALSRFLSQSRGSGLRQVIQRIKTLAAS